MTESETESVADDVVAPSMADEVRTFVRQIDSLGSSLQEVMFAVQVAQNDVGTQFNAYAKKFGEEKHRGEDGITYGFKPPHDVRATRLNEKLSRASMAVDLVPRVFVLALVGQYDAFLGRVLRFLYLARPELMANSDRALTLSQLRELGTIEGATEYLLEKEVESTLRKSHVEQFEWMENKFKIKLRNGLDAWPVFVELTERRNLFAHTDGIVSDQYLAACREHGVALPEGYERGSSLDVTPEYFRSAYSCVFEIGVKLSQVLWRKLLPDDIDKADQALTEVTFDLLVSGHLDLACRLLDFGCCVLKKHASDQNRRIMAINRAQSYKWSGEDDKCREIVDSEDWSACGPEFQLAVAVLSDNFEEAAGIMRSLGSAGAVKETEYQEWPLFREFRQSEAFLNAYQEIFGEPFVHIETTLREDEQLRAKAALEELRAKLDEELSDE
jgi:hypothetical protein